MTSLLPGLRRVAAVIAAVAAIVVLAGQALGGCAGAPAGSPAAANAADVMFLQMMIAVDQDATELLSLAKTRATREEVRQLAAAIAATQATDIETMTGWLRAWGRPTAMTTDPAAHAGHGGVHTLGPTDLAPLRPLTGPEFERAFLNLLIGYQHNGVELAGVEIASGVHPEARALAERLRTANGSQITMMLNLVQATPA